MELKAYTEGEDDSPFVILDTDQGTRIIERGDGTITITRGIHRGTPTVSTKTNARTARTTVTLTFEEKS